MIKQWIGYLVFVIFFSISAVLNANSNPIFNGIYLGAELGGQSANANQTAAGSVSLNIPPLFSSANPLSWNSKMHGDSVIGSILAGYGHSWNRFYLGGEFEVSFANSNMTNQVDTGLSQIFLNQLMITSTEAASTQIRIRPTQFGVFIRPGLLLTPTSLIYARIGASESNIKVNATSTATKQLTVTNVPVPLITQTIFMATNKSVHRPVFQIGTGMEQAINNKLSLRLDYLYSYYGSIQVSSAQMSSQQLVFFNPLSSVLTINSTQSVKISDQSLMLGVIWHG